MPDLDALNQRLREFKAASDNLELQPLLTKQDLERFWVEYQVELIDELEQAVEDCTPQNNKIVFTGHRGCGKSTLLAEFRDRMSETGQYFVVQFSIADAIEAAGVDHVNILFTTALSLLEAAEKDKEVKIKPGTKKELYRWLGSHTRTETQNVEAGIEASGGAGFNLPAIIAKFFLESKANLKANAIVREEITTKFNRQISELIGKLNEIKAYIETATKKQVLVIIDDLDKLDISVTESIFSKNIQPLLQPSFRMIYTIPITTLREVSIKRNIESNVKKIYAMRVTKFFSKAQVRKVDRIPDPACMALFREIVERRISQDLIEPTIVEEIILKSGGVLRELVRILDLCCDRCMQEVRRQIKKADFQKPLVIINQAILDMVLNDIQIQYAEPLGRVDFTRLKQVYEQLELDDVENQRILDLFHGLYILEYRNQVLWYDLNPIVADLLILNGVISAAS